MVGGAQRESTVGATRGLAGDLRLADDDKFDDAFRLAQHAQRSSLVIPSLRHSSKTSRGRRPRLRADRRRGLYRPYSRSDQAWRPLGTTPLPDATVPRGLLHVKVEMAGHEMAEDVGPAPFAARACALRFSRRIRFRPAWCGSPRAMRRSRQGSRRWNTSPVNLPDYWIDRHEVTNRAFKQFVDAGGYRRPELWQEPFVRDGRPSRSPSR